MKKRKLKSNPVWVLAVSLIFIFLVVNLALSDKISDYGSKLESVKMQSANTKIFSEGKVETGERCPDAEGGLEGSPLQIKYFYSKFCPWCIKEEPILQELVEDYGNRVHIEWYDINKCSELVDMYRISGVPTFVFSRYGNETEYPHYGFVYKKDLIKLICDITGGC